MRPGFKTTPAVRAWHSTFPMIAFHRADQFQFAETFHNLKHFFTIPDRATLQASQYALPLAGVELFPGSQPDKHHGLLAARLPWAKIVGVAQSGEKFGIDLVQIQFRQSEVRPDERGRRPLPQCVTKPQTRRPGIAQRLTGNGGQAHARQIQCAESLERPGIARSVVQAVGEITRHPADFAHALRLTRGRPLVDLALA